MLPRASRRACSAPTPRLPRAYSVVALCWCAGSLEQAFRTRTRSPCIGHQLQALRLASTFNNWRVTFPRLVPTYDLAAASVCVRGRRMWALLPCAHVAALVGAFRSRRGCQLRGWPAWGASLRCLTAPCVPACPSQPGLACMTHLPPPSTRLASLRCHERPLCFRVNDGLTPAALTRPSPSAREVLCADPLHERRREPGPHDQKCASPTPLCTCPSPKPPQPTPWPDRTFGSTNLYCPGRSLSLPTVSSDAWTVSGRSRRFGGAFGRIF